MQISGTAVIRKGVIALEVVLNRTIRRFVFTSLAIRIILLNMYLNKTILWAFQCFETPFM